jgi:tol-pal system protein YbgF
MEKGGRGGAAPAPRPTPGPGAAPAPPPPGPQGNLAANTPGAAGNNVDALYHDAFKMMQDGDYVGAERGFKTFIQRNPQHQLAGNAQYWLGESYYSRGDFQNAMTAFAEGYKSYKTGPKGPDNLLKLGVTLAKLNRKGDACAMFQRFNQDYPRANDLQKRRIEQERQRNGC